MNNILKNFFSLLVTRYLLLLLFFIPAIKSSAKVASTTVTNSTQQVTNGLVTNSQILQPVHVRPLDLKTTLARILQARLSRNDDEKSEVSSLSIKSIARTLSSLQPTFVSNLMHVSGDAPLRASQTEAFTMVRNEVLAANPRCKFDVVVKASSFTTPTEFVAKLQEINAKILPDIFLFDVANNETVVPSALAKAIEFAHAHGQGVGYQGPLTMIPDDVDFLVLRTESGELRREEISALRSRHHLPVLVHLSFHQQPRDQQEGPNEFSSAERMKLITHLAEEQSSFGYHLIYPIRHSTEPSQTFEATVNNALLVTMKALMARYN